MRTMRQIKNADCWESCSDSMEISPVLQSKLLLYTFFLGGSVGLISDIFRFTCTVLKDKRHSYSIVRFAGDLLAIVYAALGTVLLSYYFNKGEFRAFCLLGLFAGFFLYRHTLSYAVTAVLKWILSVFLHIFRIFISPFVKILKKLVIIIAKFKYYIQKALEKIKVLVYNIYVNNIIISRARKGFLMYRSNK